MKGFTRNSRPSRLIILCFVAVITSQSQIGNPVILIPGDEYSAGEIPTETSGLWWVLYRKEGSYGLVQSAVTVDAIHDSCLDETPEGRSGRRVRVAGVAAPVLLFRDIADLEPTSIRSASLPSNLRGFGKHLAVGWDGRTVEFRHVAVGDGFRVDLVDGERVQTVYGSD